MSECQRSGCRKLKTICEICGRTVSTATFRDPQEWISVKESWPPKGSTYLVYFPDGFMGLQPKGFDIGPCDPYPYKGPSHWMLAPEPPDKLPCNHEWGSEERQGTEDAYYRCNKCGDRLK